MLKVSLIATEKNESAAIAEFLDSVLSQSMRPDEIVIADADSTDGTKEIIQSYIDKGHAIRLVVVPGNRSVGRNAAVEAARNEIIAVADIGCRLDHDWLKNIVQPFLDNPGTQAVAGFFLSEPKTRFEKISSDLMLQDNAKIDVDSWLPSSRSIAFTKNAWRKAGKYPLYDGFDKKLAIKCGGEDTLFDLAIKKAGFNFADGLKAVVYWRPRPDLKTFYQQYYWYAVGDGMDLTGLADHKFFRRITVKYLLGLISLLLLGTFAWFLGLLYLVYLAWNIGKRCLTPWRKNRSLRAFLLLFTLVLAYDISQILGYWYGYSHRPARGATIGH